MVSRMDSGQTLCGTCVFLLKADLVDEKERHPSTEGAWRGTTDQASSLLCACYGLGTVPRPWRVPINRIFRPSVFPAMEQLFLVSGPMHGIILSF